jgi:hypothetical protein
MRVGAGPSPLPSALHIVNLGAPVDWRVLPGGAGYFGQAPFCDELRAFTRLTPTRYAEVRRRFLREHPGHMLDGGPRRAD